VNTGKTFDGQALLDKLGGDREFVLQLLGVALRSSVTLPGELRSACGDGDYERIAKLAHKVKGTAGDMVAEPLRELARDTELAARDSKPESVAMGLALAAALDEFLAELRVRVDTGDPT
jgi:HPt (histidine-containing phosphotransfer) domain-containing protein